jgi:hypothetical protein
VSDEDLIRGAFRIAVGPTTVLADGIGSFVSLEEGEGQYEIVAPWRDLAATPIGIELCVAGGKRFLKTNLREFGGSEFVIRALGGPHHQPEPHAVVAMRQNADDERIVAYHFPVAVMREFSSYGVGDGAGARVVWETSPHVKIES